MPDEKKLDPFKPQQPTIPGVSSDAEKTKRPAPPPKPSDALEQPAARPPVLWIALAAAAVLVLGAGLFLWSRSSSSKAGEPDSAATASTAASESKKPANSMPVAPGPVATTDELAKAWSSKRFLYRNPLSSETIPAMVVRLPGGEFWAFSLREPFGNCELEYVSSLEKLESDYHFHANHPMVGDPCNRTVYDLLRYGGSSDEGIVRGEIVQGNGIRPPTAIEIRTDGKQVIAARIE